MRKLFERQLKKATDDDGNIDIEALGRLVSAAYDEAEHDRTRTDRSIELMVEELTVFQVGLEEEIGKRTAQLRLSQQKLRTQNTRFFTALENMSQGLAMFDRNQRLLICNQQYLNMYDLPRRYGRRGTTLTAIVKARIAAGTAPDIDPGAYFEERLSTAAEGLDSSVIHHLRNGRVISVGHRAMADGGWVTMHMDITELHSMQAELAYQAYHDALTGLPNRNKLHQELETAFESLDADDSFAVLCLDLDGFKAINDTMGHAAGDDLLRQVANRLRRSVGDRGIVARMGGDEFAIMLRDAGEDQAAGLATTMLDAIRYPLDIEGHSVLVGASVGAAVAPRDGNTPDRLLNNADLALYSIKRGRRGGYRLYEPGLAGSTRGRVQLENDLRRALPNGELELWYQPILDFESGALSGFEALLRWQHPTEGTILPSLFIPLAEETGLIGPIGEWVIREAFTEAASWPHPLGIAVNVSSSQFDRGNLVGIAANALGASGLAPGRVEIEITETIFLENNSANMSVLHQLRELGLKIALDDFGVGYSALSYLLAFPFDKLKIDGSFVRALDHNPGAEAILKAVADIAARMGIVATAEGIETDEQFIKVRELGYGEGQGFLISRPLNRKGVYELLHSDAAPDLRKAGP